MSDLKSDWSSRSGPKFPGFFKKSGSGFRIPDNPESGFFKSCRARYEHSIRTLDAKLSFGGNWVQPEEISGPKFYRISPIANRFRIIWFG